MWQQIKVNIDSWYTKLKLKMFMKILINSRFLTILRQMYDDSSKF